MAKSVRKVIGGLFCCNESGKPWCNDCPYEGVYDCKNVLRNDISYWASLGKLEIGKDGNWQETGVDAPPKQKKKRKNGRRYFNNERRNQRQYGDESDSLQGL